MIKSLVEKFQTFTKKNQKEIKCLKDKAKSVVGDISSNIPAEQQENRRTLYERVTQQMDKCRSGEITKQELRQDIVLGFKFLECFDETRQEEILRWALEIEMDIKKDSDFTNDEYDIYREIVSYLLNNRQKEVKILLKKAAKKINSQELSISKEAIDFITSITDEKLKTLKEMFRYVVGNGILEYKDVAQDFDNRGFCQPSTDNIKFLGSIFVNQDSAGGKAYYQQLEAITSDRYLVLDKEKIKFYATKLPISTGIITIKLVCLAILTDVGAEMYSLLKDEIENYPDDYLKAIVEQYKNFGLVYETITQ